MKAGELQQYSTAGAIRSNDVRTRWARAAMFIAINGLALPALSRPELENPRFRLLFAFIVLGLNVLWISSNSRSGRGIGYYDKKLAELELLDSHGPSRKQHGTRVLIFADPAFQKLTAGVTLQVQLQILAGTFLGIWLLVASIFMAAVLGWKADLPLFGVYS
jgi:hypothetical protein